jgi:hypothetical protein
MDDSAVLPNRSIIPADEIGSTDPVRDGRISIIGSGLDVPNWPVLRLVPLTQDCFSMVCVGVGQR